MFGNFSHQDWNCGDDINATNLDDDPIEDVDSDSSEYQRELEIALYSQIHHETAGESFEVDAKSFTVENAEEKNGEIIRSESIEKKADVISLSSNEYNVTLDKIQPKVASTPTQGSQKPAEFIDITKTKIKLNRKRSNYPEIKDFLTVSSSDLGSSPNTRNYVKLTSDKKLTPEVLTLSSDITSDTDVAVEQHLVGGVPVAVSKKKWKKSKEDLIDLTVLGSSSSDSDSDVLQEIVDGQNDDNIILNIDNKGGRKIVLDAAELSDYEELCKLDQGNLIRGR
jgi:hypothetical protein